jgi:hypothetical protein
MQREIEWYGTTVSSCKYHETSHLCTTDGIPFPCSHQYALDADKPLIPLAFAINLRPTWQTCVLDMMEVNRDTPVQSPLHVIHLKELAMRNIRRFLHSKNKEEIKQFVESHFAIGREFALGLSISVLDLISDGIRHFSQ